MTRIPDRARRTLAAIVAVVLLVQTGCGGGPRLLSREDLIDPPDARSYLVTTRDGVHHTFVSLHVEGEMLVGTARTTVREAVGEGESARETISNRYEERRIPWPEVESVAAERGASVARGGWFLAAGSVALGVAVFLLATQGDGSPAGDGGGKEF